MEVISGMPLRESKSVFWRIKEIRPDEIGLDPFTLKSDQIAKNYSTTLNADCSFYEDANDEKNFSCDLTFDILRKSISLLSSEEMISRVNVSTRCWIELANGGISKDIIVSTASDSLQDYDADSDDGHHQFILNQDFEVMEEDFIDVTEFSRSSIVGINFEFEFVFRFRRNCQERIFATDIEDVLERFAYMDKIVQKVKANSTDAKVKLIANENDSIFIHLNELVHFSDMMKCMLASTGNMIEAKNLEVQIDPKYSIAHLNFFEKLILGSTEERTLVFSNHQSVELLKEMYEFLDMYGFDMWKPIISKRISQLVPSSELYKLEQFFLKFEPKQEEYIDDDF
jgi:hypothetical protein